MFVNTRSSGVLMHISSLPGPFGVGVLGKEALDFVDFISQLGFSAWQILPINPVDEYYSPYKSSSAFAGNYMFIDPRSLKAIGLVSQEEIDTCICTQNDTTTNYNFAAEKRLSLLRVAFSHISNTILSSLDEFSSKHKWVEPYALYMAVKESQGGTPWWQWTLGYDDYEYCKLEHEKFTQQINFWKFTQYIFYSQWSVIKNYANSKGIKIIGDMPFYISMDSADVWSNSYYFQLELNTLKPLSVSGAPPDYFSSDGQIWGNPLYNWDNLEEEGYSWWISRLDFLNNNFDIIRITHFRAYASYWSVPADAKTAKGGKWFQGPGQNFFKAVKNSLPDIILIADDLGRIEDDVIELLNSNDISGICVMQLGFEDTSESKHLPHNYNNNTVAYIGTHDNNTFLGFLYELSPEKRKFALDYCGFHGSDWSKSGCDNIACRCAFEALWRSPANLTIITIQDICGMGNSTRMNIPSTQEDNWLFRVASDYLNSIDRDYFTRINNLFKR